MSFTAKDWKDKPDHTTPISAASLEDLETRVAAAVLAGPVGPQGPGGPPGVDYQGLYNAGTTYTINQWVKGSDGLYYWSPINGNIGHDPTTDDGSHWVSQTPRSVDTGSAPSDLGNFGATRTLTLITTDTIVRGTLNANCVLTIAGGIARSSVTFILTQDGSGSRTFSISGAKTPSGLALGLSTGPAAVDVVTAFTPDGTTWYAFAAGLAMS